ncbi:hypothetical protein OUZ56_005419 [Daphnia magna]|uniref:Uncharacterized protein n=1 Tax=Daphnia magna TaxID=35525 RepID=A0ABQ9YTG9_9CRUS|nr:hypothetical protein OUZ56_005419 [Daphnia magna]
MDGKGGRMAPVTKRSDRAPVAGSLGRRESSGNRTIGGIKRSKMVRKIQLHANHGRETSGKPGSNGQVPREKIEVPGVDHRGDSRGNARVLQKCPGDSLRSSGEEL